ncbi:T9SS type A sorting domain-containing protein [bacterium SCSIO 12643]|nr:T9SS type A sorting domain-containing protein [bacterium SCSIO 12643]
MNENFSGGSLPSGWTNTDHAGTGDVWLFNDPDNRNISAGNFSGDYAILDSDYYGSSSNQDASLATPTFDASPYSTVTLSFDHQYRDYSSPESCEVQVYNGSSWTTVVSYTTGDENYSGSDLITLDITSATNGSSNARVRFRYSGNYDWWWAIDNVNITGTSPDVVASPKGPGGIGSDDGTSGLKLWLDVNTISGTNNSTITNWTDASGNNFNFSVGNGATFIESAQNDYPAFRFNGTSSYFQRAFTSDLTPTSFTIFSANKVNSSNRYKCVISNRDDPSGTATAGFILYSRPNTNYWDFWTGRSSGAWQTNSGGTSTAGSWASQMIRYDGATNNKILDINGSFDASNTHTMTLNPSQPIRVGAGRNEFSPDYYFNGDIGEIIMFNTVLSEVEEIIINNYLSAKYAIALSANDYYTQDNSGSGNFDHHVAGIGRAADGSLHNNSQGTGIVKINNPSDLNFDEFLFWGENTLNSSYGFSTSSDYTERQSSTWRVSKRNDLGTVSVSVAATDLDLTGKQSCANLYLVVSSSSSFASKTSYPMTLSSGVYTADNVSFNDNDYFTFEYIDQIVVDNSQFYNGAGTSSVPNITNACYKLLVKSSATGALPISENAEVREIEVEAGGILTINSGIYLSLAGDIVNNGTINIEEESSLIQTGAGTDNNSGAGVYNVKRTGNNSPYIFNIWSSPIQSASLTSVFSSANPCDIFVFDKDLQAWKYDFAAGYSTTCNGNSVTFGASHVISGGDGIMDVTGGYFVPGDPTALKTYNGTINNGTLNKAISTTTLGNPGGTDWADDDWNLLGNPYPSALSATAFWNENAVSNSRITDALYFWDEADTTGGYNQNSDYASWNLSGGVNSGNSAKEPSGNIASGQGFWVVANANTNVVFNNSMRTYNNSQFFKTQQQINQHNAWISFTSPSKYQNNILVGYNQTTTDAEDLGYDAHKLVGNSHVRFASYIGTDEYVIQSVAPLSIGDSKVIPLVVFSDEYGTHQFEEYKRENLPNNFEIYIRDKFLGLDHNLANGPYNVDLNPNVEYKSRFELVFKYKMQQSGGGSGSKGGGTVTSVEKNIDPDFKVLQDQNTITISHPNGINGDVTIIDITGKVLFQKQNVKSNNLQIQWHNFAAGSYFISIQNNNQRSFFKQIIKP